MASYLHASFAAAALAAIALALALGYLLGKLRVGTFVLGPVAATLLVTIAFGQVGVKVSRPSTPSRSRPTAMCPCWATRCPAPWPTCC
jgi:hypothetical protein